jgi:hypothetical protein
MSVDEFGEWTNPSIVGLAVTNTSIWNSANVLNELPSTTVRLTFSNYPKESVQSFIRVRGVIYSNNQIIHLPSNKVYHNPSLKKVIILPIPLPFLELDTWSMDVEIMKQFNSSRRGKLVDAVGYDVTVELLKESISQKAERNRLQLGEIEQKIDVLLN